MRVPLAPALILALVLGCTSRQIVSGRDLIEAPDRFAGHRIVLTGVVQDPRRPAPAGDGGYTTFTLLDGGARIPVAAPGTQSVSAGDLVEVRGVFREQARVGGELLLDTVEAELVRPLRTAAQPPGTPVGPP